MSNRSEGKGSKPNSSEYGPSTFETPATLTQWYENERRVAEQDHEDFARERDAARQSFWESHPRARNTQELRSKLKIRDAMLRELDMKAGVHYQRKGALFGKGTESDNEGVFGWRKFLREGKRKEEYAAQRDRQATLKKIARMRYDETEYEEKLRKRQA